MNSFTRFTSILGLSSCLFFAISCTDDSPRLFNNPNDLVDPVGGLSRGDYEGMTDMKSLQKPPAGKLPDPSVTPPNITAQVSEPPVPELADILAAPKPPKIGATQQVSIAVSDDVPLKDVLIELARLADVDIEVDSGITGGVSFRAKDRPFNEVIERIADLAGLRYSVKNGVLRVERDTPYIQTYTLDMLNIDRSATGNIGLTSAGGSSAASGTSGSGNSAGAGGSSSSSSSSSGGRTSNSSSSNITLESKSDFWAKFDDSIKQILSYKPARMTSTTTMSAQPTPGFAQQPTGAVLPVDTVTPAVAAAAATGSKFVDPDASRVPAAGNGPAVAAPGQPGPVTAPVNYAPPSGANVADGEPAQATFYSLNRQAGTLMVAATERQHEIVRRFLKAIEANASSQVLIEAKIVEVTLNNTYQSGIDWNKFAVGNVDFTGGFDTVKATDTAITPATVTVLSKNIFGTSADLSAAVRLLDEFGTTRALSSPRLNAMNNQQAVLTFAENIVYFKVKIKVTAAVAGTGGSAGTPPIVEVNSEQNMAPVGILLSLQPTINKDSDEITLSVRPTLSRVTKYVTDPSFPIQIAVALNNLGTDGTNADLIDKIKNTDSKVPQIETRELDSILKVKSGQVMVIGGLLEDKIIDNDSGVPGVSQIPLFGNLFKSVQKSNSKKELIIFIRATIVDPHGNATDHNKALYNKFIQDPEPLKF